MSEPLAFSILNTEEHPFLRDIIGKGKGGPKKYDARLADRMAEWRLFPGKVIKLVNSRDGRDFAYIQISDIKYYDNFASAYDCLGDDFMPGMTRDKVIRFYNQYYDSDGYEDDDGNAISSPYITKNKVVVLGLDIICAH